MADTDMTIVKMHSVHFDTIIMKIIIATILLLLLIIIIMGGGIWLSYCLYLILFLYPLKVKACNPGRTPQLSGLFV